MLQRRMTQSLRCCRGKKGWRALAPPTAEMLDIRSLPSDPSNMACTGSTLPAICSTGLSWRHVSAVATVRTPLWISAPRPLLLSDFRDTRIGGGARDRLSHLRVRHEGLRCEGR